MKFLLPQFKLRDDPKNIEAYILYELTFGYRNDRAHQITHARQGGIIQERKFKELGNRPYIVGRTQVEEIVTAYEPLAAEVEDALTSEDPAIVDAFITKVNEFRKKYPWLYTQPQKR
jgi:hypothetical protein